MVLVGKICVQQDPSGHVLCSACRDHQEDKGTHSEEIPRGGFSGKQIKKHPKQDDIV